MISIAWFFDKIYICVNISYKNETRMNIMNLGEKEKGEEGVLTVLASAALTQR